jgi:hypothetical protein
VVHTATRPSEGLAEALAGLLEKDEEQALVEAGSVQ